MSSRRSVPRRGTAVSRRMILRLPAAVGLAAIAGCSGGGATPKPRPAPSAGADADASLRQRAAAAEVRLLASYDAVLLQHPALRARLIPVRTEHAAHAAALGGAATGPPAPLRAPMTAGAAVRRLATEERAAAAARLRDCAAGTPALAALLASIGASEASHVVALTAATSRAGR